MAAGQKSRGTPKTCRLGKRKTSLSCHLWSPPAWVYHSGITYCGLNGNKNSLHLVTLLTWWSVLPAFQAGRSHRFGVTGGHRGHLQEQLRDIVAVKATTGAFAAIRGAGDVVSWGQAHCGGDCSSLGTFFFERKRGGF